MPRRRRVGRPRVRRRRAAGSGRRRTYRRRIHRRRGAGFFDFLKKAHNWIRDNKIISRVANLIPHPTAKAVGTAAGALGYGRRRYRRRHVHHHRKRVHAGGRRRRRVHRRRVHRRRGGRFMPAIPNSQLYSVASLYGGGRRRRVYRRRY